MYNKSLHQTAQCRLTQIMMTVNKAVACLAVKDQKKAAGELSRQTENKQVQLAMIETANYHRDSVIKYGMNDCVEILMDIEKTEWKS